MEEPPAGKTAEADRSRQADEAAHAGRSAAPGDGGRSPAPGDGGAVIATHGLTKRYRGGQLAVDGLDLAVPAGSVFGFLGPNGSGKTTTIRMLMGLIEPTSGTARVLGQPMPRAARAVLPHVGALIEGPALYGFLSGRDNLLRYDAADPTADPRTRRARVTAALDRVGLTAAAGKKAKAYSLGMKQRLGLAAALLQPRRLLVLDEPTNGLDPQGMREIRSLIRELASDGTTVFLSSHLLDEIEQVCTHAAVMAQGRLITQGAVAELAAGTRGRLVVTTPDTGDAARVLKEQGAGDVVITDDRVTAEPPDRDLADVNAALVRAGVRVRGFGVERASLEDAFVALTGRGSMSRADVVEQGGATGADRKPSPLWTFGLFRSELVTTFRRWRTLALLAVLAAVPILVGIAVKIETGDGSSAGGGPEGGGGPAFISQITNNGLFLVFTALAATLPFFLPMAIGVIAGDAIAGEANAGTLRYLLVAPAGRTRLLLTKYATTMTFCLVATLVVAVSALTVGALLFPLGDLTTISGTRISFGEGLARALLIALVVATSLIGVAALGLFVSTLTNSGIAAMATTVGLLITVQILDQIPQLHALQPYFFSHYWLSFADLMREPVYWDDLVKNLGLQGLYAAVFGSAAWARFTAKDITA